MILRLAMALALILSSPQGPATVAPKTTLAKKTTVIGGGTIPAQQAHLARKFNGTSDFLQSSANTTLNGSVISISFWLYQDAFDNGDELAMELSSNFNTAPGAFLIDPNGGTSSAFDFDAFTGTGTYLDCHFTRPSAAAWHHYLLILNITSTDGACAAYVDGSSVSVTKNTGSTATTWNNYTLNVMSRNGTSLFNAGRITAIAIWTADESSNVSSISSCATSPDSVDNANMQHYWKIQQVSPETPTVGTANLNVTGTTNVAGPC